MSRDITAPSLCINLTFPLKGPLSIFLCKELCSLKYIFPRCPTDPIAHRGGNWGREEAENLQQLTKLWRLLLGLASFSANIFNKIYLVGRKQTIPIFLIFLLFSFVACVLPCWFPFLSKISCFLDSANGHFIWFVPNVSCGQNWGKHHIFLCHVNMVQIRTVRVSKCHQ